VVAAELERGRQAYERKAWREAYEVLSQLAASDALEADDLERLAVAAYLLALDDECGTFLERAHHRFLDDGRTLRAIRCAFWLGMTLIFRGEVGPGSGWLARGQRLLENEPEEAAEHGYLLLPVAFRQEAEGHWEAAIATAERATALAERVGDADLYALGAQMQGHLLVANGRIAQGLPLLDEAMVTATSGAESPIVIGIVYCGVVLACVESYDVRRAREWTDVLARWCREQPDLVAFTGRCLIHRSEIKQLRGDWDGALDEARLAGERLALGFNRPATAQAFYRQGELHRLRGDLDAAEKAYAAASRYGLEPLPGLALLRLAQRRAEDAGSALRRALAETTELPRRAALLPAVVETLLALGDLDAAREACRELEEVAAEFGSMLLAATAAQGRGAVLLGDGDPAAALVSLRDGWQKWEELGAPYEAARARVLISLACRQLGDDATATWELEAARDAFKALGARPDAAQVASLLAGGEPRDSHGLTARELEVLRLVAAGKSNREIAGALVISEHTVARHLQNVFAKLDVSSRTAASAFAYEHDLV
jgi:ATP/maltotriose-dependent transcriptional regulator MalT